MERTIGLARVFVVHVNDSKTEFGSRVDRHEHIGKGKIGAEALGRVLRHPMLAPSRLPGRAFLLETPIDAPGDDRRNVAAVWKLVGVAVEQAPDAEDGFSMLKTVKPLVQSTGKASKREGAKKISKANLRAKTKAKTTSKKTHKKRVGRKKGKRG
jgi:hypothetical protein